MNYTLIITQYQATGSHVTFSATSTVPGVTLTVNPKEFDFLGTQEAVVLGISVAPAVNSSILPVEFRASSADGSTNSTLAFKLDKALVLVLPSGELMPPTLHIGTGQTVTWLNLVDPHGEANGNGWASVVLAGGSAASPMMSQNDVWRHAFDKPGTYPYQVTVSGYETPSGVIIVA